MYKRDTLLLLCTLATRVHCHVENRSLGQCTCMNTMILFCMLLLVPMISSARAQENYTVPMCTIADFPARVFKEEDVGYYVKPNLTCSSPGIMEVQLDFNYTLSLLERSRIQLFYECKSPASENVTVNLIEESDHTAVNDNIYTVSLSESLNASGTSCEVWGCYQRDFFLGPTVYPIDNATCTFMALTTQPITELATERPPAVSTETTTIPHIAPSITMATSLPVSTSLPTNSSPSAHIIDVIVPVIIIIAVVTLVCLSILVCIILRLQQVQRKKHSMLKYYNYREPIDPYFSPIDINARVKSVASLVSEFDIFVFQTNSSNSTDDERSQVLHATNNSSDTCTSSVKSIMFVDKPSRNENKQGSSPETSREQPPVDDSSSKELKGQSPQNNGYVPSNYLPGERTPGYVVENFNTATIPNQNVQVQSHGRQADKRQKECSNGLTLSQYGTQLSISSLSSGYVTDLTTPSECRKYLTSADPGKGMVTLNPAPTLVSEYPMFDSVVQTIDERLHEEEADTDTVVYSFGEGGCEVAVEDECVENEEECEAFGGVTEHKYAESIMAECSLSLNPLHFEPINYDELVEQTSPSYVNTTPGAELYQTQFND